MEPIFTIKPELESHWLGQACAVIVHANFLGLGL